MLPLRLRSCGYFLLGCFLFDCFYFGGYIALYSIRPCFYHQSHPQLGIVFALALCLPSFFLELFLHWSPVAYWAPTDLGSSSFNVLSFCLFYCSWGFQGKNTEVVCHSLLRWTTFCQLSPPWPSHLGWTHMAWLSFTELDKAVVLVWLDWLVFCDYGFSVSALWCPLTTPTILLGFLLPWMWSISSWLPVTLVPSSHCPLLQWYSLWYTISFNYHFMW